MSLLWIAAVCVLHTSAVRAVSGDDLPDEFAKHLEYLTFINGTRISCVFCEYIGLKSELVGPGRTDNEKTLSKMIKSHQCVADSSNLRVCGAGIRTCALSIVEEKLRLKPTDTDYNDSVMKVSHFCGNVGETSTGCEWFETITLGVGVSCRCEGTSCNNGINSAPAIRAGSQATVAAAAVITAAYVMLIN